MAPSDTELLLQAQRGDFAAFEQLVFRYDKDVLTIAARYVNNADDAKDIYQEVFLRVYKGLRKFRGGSEFSTWLFRVATNVCLTYRARRRRHSYTSLDEDLESEERESDRYDHTVPEGTSTDQQTIDSELSMHVERAMAALSPQQRLVFTLRHYKEYRIKEIAEMMDCSEGTVKKYLFEATRRMREQLRDVLDRN